MGELWIITTTGRVDPEVQKVKDWHSLLVQHLKLKIWQVAGTDDLGSEQNVSG